MIIIAIKFYLKKKSMILLSIVFQYVGWGGSIPTYKTKEKKLSNKAGIMMCMPGSVLTQTVNIYVRT